MPPYSAFLLIKVVTRSPTYLKKDLLYPPMYLLLLNELTFVF